MPRIVNKPVGALDYKEAAAHLGIMRRTLFKLVANGDVRCIRPTTGRNGRHAGRSGVPVFFFKNDLDRYLQSTANFQH